MAFGRIRSKKPDPDDVPPPPPPNMFDPDVIEAADEDAQKYKERASQEVTVKAYKKGTVGTGSNPNKKWYILGALLLVVVIIAAAVGGAMAGKGNSGSGSAASSTTGSDSTADEWWLDTAGGGTTGGGVAVTGGDVEDDFGNACVPCTDIPTEFMISTGLTCETFNNYENRCGTPGSWWFDDRDWDDDWADPYPPQSYCQYSCYQAGFGYPDFSPCCPDVVDALGSIQKDGPCVPCTDIPNEFMLDNGVDCITDNGIIDLCGKDGSWWYNARDWDDDWLDPYPAETYCQYSCDARGLPYPSARNCCAERGSDINEFYDYSGGAAAVTPEPTPEPTPTPIPDFGDLDVDGDCDGADGDICGLCQGDCDDDIDCEDGHFCFQRDDDEDVPGCNGDAEDGIDYCIPEFYRDN